MNGFSLVVASLFSPLAAQLANLEVGGTKGKVLTTSVAQIHLDFGLAVEAVKNVNYDVMDLDAASAFEDIYQTFRSVVSCAAYGWSVYIPTRKRKSGAQNNINTINRLWKVSLFLMLTYGSTPFTGSTPLR